LVLKPVCELLTVTSARDTVAPEGSLISPSSTPTGFCAATCQQKQTENDKSVFRK